MNLMAMLATIGLRLDAAYTSILGDKLEALRSKTYDLLFPTLKARMLIPTDTSIDTGAESHAYMEYSDVGMAKLIANYADDLPNVEVKGEKITGTIEGIGVSYSLSLQDLRRSAMSGVDLPGKKARAARKFVERKIDDIAAVGDKATKLPGLLTHPNVTILTAKNDGTATTWIRSGATANKIGMLILEDMHNMASSMVETTKGVHMPSTLLLPTKQRAHIAQTQVTGDNSLTILKSFLANSDSVTAVESWYKLATADAAGTGPRAVAYEKSPEILELIIPQDFEQLPAQAKSLAFVTPCHARCGGTVVYRPLGVIYQDGI
ncbi:MAG: DUF2184 domain-containing protein [Deltaproteobacteria bacterium]|nr:DUF2184 domain-containing protein [Deltaproteobacteria bacterium]